MTITHSKQSNLLNRKTVFFDEDTTMLVGIEAAIVLNRLMYWTDPARCQHKINDQYWTYNSLPNWIKQFPYFTERTLRRIFKKLEEMELISTRKMNSHRRDQTKWYTVNISNLTMRLKHIQPQKLHPVTCQETFISNDKFESAEQNQNTVLNDTTAEISKSKTQHSQAQHEDQIGHMQLANLANCTSGQFGHISKDTITTLKNNSLSLKKETSEIEREMIKIWNQKIEENPEKVILTPWRQRHLKNAFQNFFKSDLKEWQNYCQIISQNEFLMGGGPRGWKANLDWALKDENIQKVLEKSYTGQKTKSSQQENSQHTDSDFNVEQIQGNENWRKIATILVKKLGVDTFKSWFLTAKFKDEKDRYPCLQYDSPFMANWVNNHFGQSVEAAVKHVLPDTHFLTISV